MTVRRLLKLAAKVFALTAVPFAAGLAIAVWIQHAANPTD